MKSKRFFLIFLLFILFSCQENKKVKLSEGGFYFWKTTFQLDSSEKKALENTPNSQLYIREFDVDFRNGKPEPVKIITWKDQRPKDYVPVIFITNRTFQFADFKQIDRLTINIFDYFNKRKLPEEIQLDCDWTESTKAKYFYFLQKIKEKTGRKISATIRLHQIKFFEKTGIPAADEGSLMVYNTGDWRKYSEINSVFDAHTVSAYLDRLNKYPLALKIALPIFSQTIVYRSGIFHAFLPKISLNILKNASFLSETKNDLIFECKSSGQIGGVHLRKGDVLKFEQPEFDEVLKIKKLILSKLNQKSTAIILFHLDKTCLKNYETKTLFE
ncbi:MAG: hypothetical protein IPP05_13605 [Cytophagaceae bacterium]|nr:hypothetical protein [Cytophagaceae bacterium]MBL0301579.1 hypothetical protein [Cytophagaceae bacterium]